MLARLREEGNRQDRQKHHDGDEGLAEEGDDFCARAACGMDDADVEVQHPRRIGARGEALQPEQPRAGARRA